jgi:hypothetical protein
MEQTGRKTKLVLEICAIWISTVESRQGWGTGELCSMLVRKKYFEAWTDVFKDSAVAHGVNGCVFLK